MGVNGLLDVARKTFNETLEDINMLIESYKETYNIPNLQLQYSAKRGYFMRVNVPAPILPKIFIQVLQQKKFVKFSSEELISLNQKQKDSMTEILQLSNRMLEELFHDLRSNIGAIYNINDTIALLDLISSFVTFISLNPCCTRPNITKENKLTIINGRHPIQFLLGLEKDFIPNDTICSQEKNFHLITGANMSGKSTYIKQVALLVILAHIGCFVTADSCTIRITDHLFSRIGTSDSVEDNASSFMIEMREMAYIMHNMTPKSLIIIDELGRGTSFMDACSLAWSCCEKLLSETCFTFFVTHYAQLVQLTYLYANVKLSFLDIDQQENQIIYKHRLREGMDKSENYGIALAKIKVVFPSEVIEQANKITKYLKLQSKRNSNSKSEQWRFTCIQVAKDLQSLKYSSLDDTDVRELLFSLQQKLKST